jgi:uncharacterized repeat protein (TIGR01451 family)
MVVDHTLVVAEGDETDNSMATSFTVLDSDLAVSAFECDSESVPGQPFHLSYTIVNTGCWVTSDVPIRIALRDAGDCGVPDAPGYEIDTAWISGTEDFVWDSDLQLRYASQEWDLTIDPCDDVPGTTWICLEVDSLDVVDESSEINNAALDHHVVWEPMVDLTLSLNGSSCGPATAVPGEEYHWGFELFSLGTEAISGAIVEAPIPAGFSGGTWSSSPRECFVLKHTQPAVAGRSVGTGSVDDAVNLQRFDGLYYDIFWLVAPDATGSSVLTATVEPPAGTTDQDPGNNVTTCPVAFTPEADLVVDLDNGTDVVPAGGLVTYTITVSNQGPSDAPGAFVSNQCWGDVTDVAWSCLSTGGGDCTLSGVGDINDTVDLPAGPTLVYSSTVSVDPEATTMNLLDIASVSCPSGVAERDGSNNSSTDDDEVVPSLFIDGFESGDTSRWSSEQPSDTTVADG